MDLRESGENYLEAILVLQQKTGVVHSIDVANYLNVTKPSVSRAMGILKDADYIWVEKGGQLHLTEAGKKIAESIYERHRLLTEYLVHLGVDEQTAASDACRIEHVISEQSFQKIKEHAGGKK
ncbi:metal-dependent transcriptional regulator [Christensenella timonensis]|uniref:metal-dependent transcriptional regulator n=1 Tax=Christensenella timonensis TaxID=1816678 RepID=UPI00082A5D66|nr:metal-dependent transcriptional regulator [Christensenella timonensis]